MSAAVILSNFPTSPCRQVKAEAVQIARKPETKVSIGEPYRSQLEVCRSEAYQSLVLRPVEPSPAWLTITAVQPAIGAVDSDRTDRTDAEGNRSEKNSDGLEDAGEAIADEAIDITQKANQALSSADAQTSRTIDFVLASQENAPPTCPSRPDLGSCDVKLTIEFLNARQVIDTQSFTLQLRQPSKYSILDALNQFRQAVVPVFIWMLEPGISLTVTLLVILAGFFIARHRIRLKPVSVETQPYARSQPADTPVGTAIRLVRQPSDLAITSPRYLQQNWRYLRRFVREGIPIELDIEATVNQIARDGLLLEPSLRPRRVNRTELLLLIDQDGSMTPFSLFAEQLAQTAEQGGRLGNAGVYYFNNCPYEYLYRDSGYQEEILIEDILKHLHPQYASVMIFSDAGAARGRYNTVRVEMTQAFLAELQPCVRHIVWLNPVPQQRWARTSAIDIAQSVPMFEFSHRGFQSAIQVLRGSPYSLSKTGPSTGYRYDSAASNQ
ncbi:MAG: hypothetical protein F6J97_25700 [Leptolyngbya sp. SIO4C1]|nr:hypothetical protein [Leptolyngbya sp. SIO4C1]